MGDPSFDYGGHEAGGITHAIQEFYMIMMLPTIDNDKSGLKAFGGGGETMQSDVGWDGMAATIHKGFLLPAASMGCKCTAHANGTKTIVF